MTKIDIISGFLGAGKTTLIKKLLKEGFKGEKVVLIENEFGEIGIDGTLLKDYGIEIREMNSGCICCTISGDFSLALKEMLKLYRPDRIIIEPSGVGKLSDVIRACGQFTKEGSAGLNMCITIIDGTKYKMYLKNFAEFYKDQLMNAGTVILSRTRSMKADAVEYIVKDMRKYNDTSSIVTTDWDRIDGSKIIELAENAENADLKKELIASVRKEYTRADFAPAVESVEEAIIKSVIKVPLPARKKEVRYGNVNIAKHHHADEVFDVWGTETAKIYSGDQLNVILSSLEKAEGFILRAKGILNSEEGKWLQFDYVPGEITINESVPDYTGRICVIGENMDKEELSELFGV